MSEMFLNIITPCTRLMNLGIMYESINIPESNYRWLVVVDGPKPDPIHQVPPTAELHYHWDKQSRWGNAQRNRALDLVEKGYVYFLDDDTTIHPEMWETVCNLTNDFIHFNQRWMDGRKRVGGMIRVNHVDSGNVIIHESLIGNRRWVLDKRYADGVFITECFMDSQRSIYIPKVLSIYNTLR